MLLFGIIYPIIAWFSSNGPLRTTERSAGGVLTAAFDHGPGLDEEPKAVFLNGTVPVRAGEEAQDVRKKEWVWMESVRLAMLKQGETALVDWQ